MVREEIITLSNQPTQFVENARTCHLTLVRTTRTGASLLVKYMLGRTLSTSSPSLPGSPSGRFAECMKAASEVDFRPYLQDGLLVTENSKPAANLRHNDIEVEISLKVDKAKRNFDMIRGEFAAKQKYMPKSCDSLVLILCINVKIPSLHVQIPFV